MKNNTEEFESEGLLSAIFFIKSISLVSAIVPLIFLANDLFKDTITDLRMLYLIFGSVLSFFVYFYMSGAFEIVADADE